MQWFYADQGKSTGPISEDEFQKLVAAGSITPQTLVWHEGMKEWAKHETITQQSHVVTNQVPGSPEDFTGGTGETSNKDLMAQARAGLTGNWALAIAACAVVQFISAAFGIPHPILIVLMPIMILLSAGPFATGLSTFFITLSRRQEPQFSMIFAGFHRFGTSVLAFILLLLLYLFWAIVIMLLPLLILGALAFFTKSPKILSLAPIIITIILIRFILSYAMTFFIIADNNEAGAWEAIKTSTKIMNGVRGKFFCLYLRFIPWMLLIIAPCFALIPMLIRAAITITSPSPAEILGVLGGMIFYFLAAMLWAFIGSLWLTPYIWTSIACFYNDIKGRTGNA